MISPPAIHVIELPSGKPLPVELTHALDIAEISLNHHGASNERKIALIDRNQDLHITPIHKKVCFNIFLHIMNRKGGI